MSDIKEMSEEFKKFVDLQRFSEAQHKTINELSKKIVDLEAERNHLKELLASTTQLQTSDNKPMIIDLGISNEEIIAATELRKIKETCLTQNGQLTLEETRKFEIYTKILASIRGKGKEEKVLEKMDDKALLSLVENNE